MLSLAKSNFRGVNQGFTLIELLIYVVVLTLVSGVVIAFIFQTLGINESSRQIRESSDNARRILDTIAQEVRHAKSVYSPTSVFSIHPGQLSLETTRDLPEDVPPDMTTYVDFYLDNGGVFVKREGKEEQLLSSEKVEVTNLVFKEVGGAVKIDLTVRYREPMGSGSRNQVSMTTNAAVRAK